VREDLGGVKFCNTFSVTAKTATPTKVDSELSDAHLESLRR
jgi:hypothetical protein